MKAPKVKRVKAEHMWSTEGFDRRVTMLTGLRPHPDWGEGVEHFILPADVESYERMVTQVARSLCNSDNFRPNWATSYSNAARAALRAIGIVPPKKGRK